MIAASLIMLGVFLVSSSRRSCNVFFLSARATFTLVAASADSLSALSSLDGFGSSGFSAMQLERRGIVSGATAGSCGAGASGGCSSRGKYSSSSSSKNIGVGVALWTMESRLDNSAGISSVSRWSGCLGGVLRGFQGNGHGKS